MLNNQDVLILMATYNGDVYIEDQIVSIINQDFKYWKLLIRDDGSTDETKKIIQRFILTDSRIELVDDSFGNLGVVRNFGCLLEIAKERKAQYVCFSDQDDYWLSDKLSKQLENMQKLETQQIPILIHSDLSVVDNTLNIIHVSFFKYMNLKYIDKDCLEILLTANFITGCTVMINNRLLEIAVPQPLDVGMHDWWLGICAAACGKIVFINTPLVLYRQHSSNAVGANSSQPLCLRMLSSDFFKRQRFSGLRRVIKQVTELEKRVCNFNLCSKKSYNLIEDFLNIWRVKSGLKKILFIINMRTKMNSILKDIEYKFILIISIFFINIERKNIIN